MKTLVLSVVFAVTSIVNAVNNNSLEGFAYNTRMDGDRVETKNVYKVKEDKYLQNHLQYNYAYDAEVYPAKRYRNGVKATNASRNSIA